MTSRKSLLINLLNIEKDFEEIRKGLSKFDWDSEELVVLQRDHLKKLLEKYLAGEVTNSNITEWADIIEFRDDIGFENSHEEVIKQIIFELANPDINGPLDTHRANHYLRLLE